MGSEARTQRMRSVLSRRLGRVRCAIEAVYHRHNVSAILRTCDSLGLHHVHLVEGHFKPAHGASRGAERWLDLHRHASAEHAIATLRAAGCRIYVADLSDDAVPPEGVPLDEGPVCIWMGAELAGVSEAARAAADGVITIPMHGFAQSLNVSVAAALALRPVAERARQLGEVALLDGPEKQRTWSRWMERAENIDLNARAVAALRQD